MSKLIISILILFFVCSFYSYADKDSIKRQVYDVCDLYEMDPQLILSIIYHESNFKQYAKNGNHLGLMQVSTKWHKKRAERLGVTDWYDTKSNILIGVDYMSELINTTGKIDLSLMVYNMGWTRARKFYNKGIISSYAKSVILLAETYRKENNIWRHKTGKEYLLGALEQGRINLSRWLSNWQRNKYERGPPRHK